MLAAAARWRVGEEIRSVGAGAVAPIVRGGETKGGLIAKPRGGPASTAQCADLASDPVT